MIQKVNQLSSSGLTGTKTTMFATTGTNGQSFYCTTYDMIFDWIKDRWWPRDPDPRCGFVIKDEFGAAALPSQLDWIGTGTVNVSAGTLTTPGMFSIVQSVTATRSGLVLGAGAFLLGTLDLYIEAIVAVPTLSNGTDNACFAFGLNDNAAYSTTGACTDGAYITLDPVDTHWITNTSTNTTLTSKTSTTVPLAATAYRTAVFVEAATLATFYVNGVAITTPHATNIPTGAGRQTGIGFFLHKTLGAGSLTLQVDQFSGWGAFNGQRVS